MPHLLSRRAALGHLGAAAAALAAPPLLAQGKWPDKPIRI
ncbi:MAG: twin-arginine translocation signal domain-containing protein, partial [Variovorax sp.]